MTKINCLFLDFVDKDLQKKTLGLGTLLWAGKNVHVGNALQM